MESDIRLDQHLVIIEATDLILDAPERRSNPDGYRRALVHGPNDQLVINYSGDYPAGVSINGPIHVPELDPRPRQQSPGGPKIGPGGHGGPLGIPPEVLQQLGSVDVAKLLTEVEAPVTLAAEIKRLRQAILTLNRRLIKLEGGA